jgi:hypothetical protein
VREKATEVEEEDDYTYDAASCGKGLG